MGFCPIIKEECKHFECEIYNDRQECCILSFTPELIEKLEDLASSIDKMKLSVSSGLSELI